MSAKTVLVIEDNELNMKLVLALLQIGNCRALEASDAGTGIALAIEHLPDLILMDIQLPDMDGLSATRQIKGNPRTSAIPIIALTGFAMAEDEQKALDAGCEGYMSKPINTKTFLQTIEDFMQKKDPAPERKKNSATPVILIVDDDPLNVKLIDALLSSDYQTFKAYDGLEALEKAHKIMPDLILLDIMMPNLDGYGVTRQLKANALTRHIPIIMITALDGVDDKAKGIEAGADEFLNKPVNQTELKARVKSLLKLKVYQEQLSARVESEERLVSAERLPESEKSINGLPTILLVEDDRKDQNLFKLYLENLPYRLLMVQNGEEAIIECQKGKVDLVLLDLILPGIDGFDVCRSLKENDSTRDIQILMVSSQSDLESKLKGLELGADDFLIKPVIREELMVRIKSLFKKKLYLDQLVSRYETALNAAITDRLTGLFNHSYFKYFLEHELKRCRRQKEPMALIMIDIDDFKQYNDTYGHPAGDAILRLFGRLIKRNIREVDLAARYGGEEFAVVLPYADLEAAERVAERILTNIRKCSLSEGPSHHFERKTASLGIACCPKDGETVADLLQRADEALYRAKRKGKNQICIY
jgi:two-component system, cell cycle response regulator